MKTYRAVTQTLALALAVALALGSPTYSVGAPEPPSRGPRSVIVGWKDEAAVGGSATVRLKALGLRAERTLRRANATVVAVPDDASADALVDALARRPDVAFAEPDYPVYPAWTPNDPIFNALLTTTPNQWAPRRVQAEDAWDITRGSADVTIAVLDSGADLDHPDLASQLVTSTAYDFVDGDGQPDDGFNHGSMVAGIAGAATDNGIGIAGLAPQARVLPLRILNDLGEGTVSQLVAAIDHAVLHGADVINMSVGLTVSTRSLREAVQRASESGVVLVAAAGNDGGAQTWYPASYPGVIAVGATTASDARAVYSNKGPTLDIMAPGGSGTGTAAIWSTSSTGDYAAGVGTSFATPHVSAATALVLSVAATATPDQVENVLLWTAKDLGAVGWDEETGWGLLQLADALNHAAAPDSIPPVTTSDALAVYPGPAKITLAARDDYSGVADTRWSLDGATFASGTTVHVTQPGTHSLKFFSVDRAGNQETVREVAFFIGGPAEVDRLEGPDRYATAIAVSKAHFADGSAPRVVLASGEGFADGLAASALAGAYGSPLLLTRRSTLPDGIVPELTRLTAASVTIIGGPAAVSSDVERSLRSRGLSVTRVAGADRYATASAVADELKAVLGGGPLETAFVVRGDDFADALAVAPGSAAAGIPVLLTRPGSLPDATTASLVRLGVKDVVIAGGEAAVSGAVATRIGGVVGRTPVRWSGGDRYETAATVARQMVGHGWVSGSYVGVATGLRFPDALGGGVAAGDRGGFVLLTRPTDLPAAARSALEDLGSSGMPVRIYGGTSAVSAAVESQLRAIPLP